MDWPRLSEKEDTPYLIFKDGIDVNDISQGKLGDRYFLGALAILGNGDTRNKFVFIETDDEWTICGAFCVKFYDNGKEDIVIVDDCFPFLNNELAFCTGGEKNKHELWPSILEKAYAKRYGSYQGIKSGKLNLAL